MLANRKTVEKNLARALSQIEQGWDDWVTNEVAGRCLRALDRPGEAETYLRKVLQHRPDPTEHYQWLAVGAVHRLLVEDA